MKKVTIDCCEMALAQNSDFRVTFVQETTTADGSEIISIITRSHCPMSIAIQTIAFNQSVPNGFKDSYMIEPEKVDSIGHVEQK